MGRSARADELDVAEQLPTGPHSAASDELVEHVASTFHTLIRSWHYDPAAAGPDDDRRVEVVPLEPWIVDTTDPEWHAAGRPEVDLANVWWADLPADWRAAFIGLAAQAAAAVVCAIESGLTVTDLDRDHDFKAAVAARLGRPWLAPPRVLDHGEPVEGRHAVGLVLVRAAIHVYAGRLSGFTRLGSLPVFPSPDPARMIQLRGFERHAEDDKTASFRLTGERLDPEYLTALTGLQPERAYRRGDLKIRPSTGHLYRPYPTGLWLISTDEAVDPAGSTLEEHLLWLLDALEPHTEALRAHIGQRGLQADFFCGYWQRDWNSEWSLAAGTLARMAALGASLSYDAYIDVDVDGADAEAEDMPADDVAVDDIDAADDLADDAPGREDPTDGPA